MAISGCYGDDYHANGNFAADGIVKAERYEGEGLIDSLSNLENDPIYIFSGFLDDDIPEDKQQAQKTFYDNFNSNVKFVQEMEMGHVVPSPFWEEATREYMGDFDMAGDMLRHVMSNIDTNPIASLNNGTTDW